MRAPYLKPVFVFSGIGTQWRGMGTELLDSAPAFFKEASAFDKAYSAVSGTSLLPMLRGETDIAQSAQGHPCVIAVEIGLFALLRDKGVEPAAIVGHSGGEVAAACAAGALTLRDAALLAWAHSRILARVAGRGAMAHVSLPANELKPFLAKHPDVTIAVVNSPQAVVIGGPADSIIAILAEIAASTGVFCRQLRIDSPLHTAAVDPFLDEFDRALSSLHPSAPSTPIYSSLRGGLARPGDFDTAYWHAHIRQPVAFSSAMDAVLSTGAERFLEISPHAVLQDAIMDCARTSGRVVKTAGLMRRDEKTAPILAEALTLLESGAATPAAVSMTPELTRILEEAPEKQAAGLAAVISECLTAISEGTIAPTPHQAFAVMGVTSLLAVKLRSAVCARLGVDLPVAVVYSYPTIAQLAGHIRARFASVPQPPSASRDARRDLHLKDPLAIVGFSCRLPGGAHDPESLWTLVENGVDAVIRVPPSRWDADRYYDPDPEAPGMSRTREGGFLTCPIDGFDAPFFGISAREARQLDPQQRLLLEVMWEAFERAGIDIAALRGSRTGVFIGMSSIDYSHAHRDSYRRDLIDAYSLTGTTFSGAAGRLSYLYDFHGPCFTVDTACSSSLVALHCACRSLREGESDAAVVGGVNLMLIPDLHVAFTKLGAVSPDGRSKSFDDGADGYGRGEGCVMLVLKRLADAERAGDPILAVVRGTAVNQDGKSNGLTAPNGLAQQRVIADALADAGLAPGDVSYVEAHGTGTALGDSIEIQSLAEAYGAGRTRDNPLMIGSIKANVGHLEPAAAVTGLAKIICAMSHRRIPANIHIQTPNTRFDWQRYPIVAPTESTPWEPESGIRRAGLSAFGFSGTNGHAIVEEYIPKSRQPAGSACPPAFMLPLSAKSPESLAALRDRYADSVAALTGNDLASFCFTALAGRTHHRWRMAVSGADGHALAKLLRNAPLPAEPAGTPAVAMVFTGQGSQYPGMGKDLVDHVPVFKAAIDECAGILLDHGIELKRLLYGGVGADELEQTVNAQPVIASIEYALWRLWTSWGVKPAAVAGHSIGEYPAAVAAGVMTVSQMLALVAARARAMGDAAPNGAMAALLTTETAVRAALARHPGVVIAAVNAPEAVTVAGPAKSVQALCDDLAKTGVNARKLRVSHAFHSPLMKEAAASFRNALAGMTISPPRDAVFVSTVTGREETDAVTKPEYWVNQILQPVRFADAVAGIAGVCPVALEAGGTAALSGLIAQSTDAVVAVSSLSPKTGAASALFEAAARLYAAGIDLDGTALYGPFACRKVALPTYPFDRKSHWMPVHAEPPTGNADSHPALGSRIDSPALNGAAVFESVFDDRQPVFLHEHIIYGKPISPGAGHLAMVFAAIREVWGSPASELLNVEFLAPLVVPAGMRRRVQIILDSTTGDTSAFRVVSRADASPNWTVHCTGTVVRAPGARPAASAWQSPSDATMRAVSKEEFYNTFVNAGYDIGKGFQRIEAIKATDGEAVCRVAVRRGDAGERGHVAYPGAIDSILQTGLPCFMHTYMKDLLKDGATIVPMHIEKVVLWRDMPDEVVCRSWSKRIEDTLVSFHIVAMTPDGDPVMEMDGLIMRQTDRQTLYRALEADTAEWLYTREWISAPAPAADGSGELIVIGSGAGTLASMIHARRGGLLLKDGLGRAALDTLASAIGRGMKTVVLAHDAPEGVKASGDPTDAAIDAGMMFIEAAGFLIRKELNAALWVVTRGAAGPDASETGLAGSALWGAAMSLTAEDPLRAGGVLDTDLSEPSIALASAFVGGTGGHPLGAIRNGQYHALRLVRTPSRVEARPIRADRSYVITGGSGALGLSLARWLADQGAGAIILASRSGVGADKLAALNAAGPSKGRLVDFRCDASNPGDVDRLLRGVDDSLLPLAGVFHAAGVLDDATIPEMSLDKFARVMEPKARGAWLLHQATAGRSLDWFVLFSSAASLLGSGGQANYAAANMLLNQLAAVRRQAGLPALSVCWGPWAGGGMAGVNEKRGSRLAANGILELDPPKALDALARAAGTGRPVIGVMAMDWALFIGTRAALHADYLAAFAPPAGASEKASGPVAAGRLAQILREPGPTQRDRLEEALSELAARTLGFADAARIATRQPLMEQGFDSLMAVEIRNHLMKDTGVKLSASFLFSYPTIEKIAAWFVGNSQPKAEEPKQGVTDLLNEIDRLIE